MPLGVPNLLLVTALMDAGKQEEMEVEIVNTKLTGVFTRSANPAFILRSH